MVVVVGKWEGTGEDAHRQRVVTQSHSLSLAVSSARDVFSVMLPVGQNVRSAGD